MSDLVAKTKTIYIAGPMRGIKWFNFPEFDAARDELAAAGWTVLSPADLDRDAGFDPFTIDPEGYDWMDLEVLDFCLFHAIDRDVEALKKCDAIYMLDGWQNSRGAKAEKAIAEWMGLDVLYQSTEGVLDEAKRITSGDRQAQYGPPNQDFERTAKAWSALFGWDVRADQVAAAMVVLKLSRQQHQRKRDNWVDVAGYAHCGAVCDASGGDN